MTETLLKIVGTSTLVAVVGLLVLALVVYIAWRVLKHKLGGFVAKAALASQPTEIHLVRERAPAWDDRDAVAAQVDALRALGFRAIGTWGVQEIPALQFVALAHPGEGMAAAVYEHDDAGSWVDLFARLRDDGTRFTASNTPQRMKEKAPPGFEKHYLKPGASVEKLWKRFHDKLKHRLVDPVTPSSFVGEFEAAWNAEILARFEQAGIEPDGSFAAEGHAAAEASRDPEQDAAAAPLFAAIAARDADALRAAISGVAGTSALEGRDDDGKTPLMAAVLTADQSFVQPLLDAGADPSATVPGRPNAPFQRPPSMVEMADEIDDPEAKQFMQGFGRMLGSAATSVDGAGTITPVLLGLFVEDLYLVAALIQAGATVEGPGTSPRPLHYAVARGDLDAATWLLQSGADPNAPDGAGGEDGDRPLEVAVEHRDVEAVRLLLEHGADPDAKNEDGDTPIVLAAMLGAEEVFEVLAPHAKKNLRKARKELQETANPEENVGAEALTRAALDGAIPRVRRLLAQGVPVDATTDADATAAMLAAQGGHVRLLHLLLDAGADPNHRTEDGETPLDRAATPQFMDPRVQPQVIQILLDAGANLEALDEENRARVVRALERGGAPVLPPA